MNICAKYNHLDNIKWPLRRSASKYCYANLHTNMPIVKDRRQITPQYFTRRITSEFHTTNFMLLIIKIKKNLVGFKKYNVIIIFPKSKNNINYFEIKI